MHNKTICFTIQTTQCLGSIHLHLHLLMKVCGKRNISVPDYPYLRDLCFLTYRNPILLHGMHPMDSDHRSKLTSIDEGVGWESRDLHHLCLVLELRLRERRRKRLSGVELWEYVNREFKRLERVDFHTRGERGPHDKCELVSGGKRASWWTFEKGLLDFRMGRVDVLN
jgi:hypothetical protein